MRSPRGTVLVYHAIGDCPRSDDPASLFVSANRFAEQMAILAGIAEVVDLRTIVAGTVRRAARPIVAITFDDGYRSVLEHAAPILARHGFPATVFVPTTWLGRRNEWDEPTSCSLEIMGPGELLEAERSGLRIESHGAAHLDLGQVSVDEMERDLRASIETLLDVLGRRPRLLAYPYGSRSPAVLQAADRLGFDAAFTVDELHGGRFAWQRVGITPLDGRALFMLKASGLYLPFRRSRVGSAVYAAVRPLFRRRWS